MEIWKELVYNGVIYSNHEISNTGKLRNKTTGRIRSTYVDRRGYECVSIHKHSSDGKKKHTHIKIHRAVACTFIDNPENKETVNHKDGDKLNNDVDNLEWNTVQENHDHSMETLGYKEMFSDTMKRTFARAVIQMDLDGKELKVWDSCRDVERDLGFAHENIAACARGKTKQSHGFKWKYLEE